MSKLRFDVVQDAFKKKAVPIESVQGHPSDYFGELVFTRDKMRGYLDPDVFRALTDCIEGGSPLDRKTADEVAHGMRVWAMEHGVTHVSHWFQPLTEGTAEKHDSFLEYDGKGGMIENFDGSSLVQQEPDASSFPNGGIRATFEARGYTAWDPTSPVFIQDDTLCIPSLFISYTGEALDYKTPLKRSLKAVNDAALPICRMFDESVRKVVCYLGWEQEYFLVDEDLYAARPDLMLSGRTLFGHEPSKSQQLDDHYFGAIPSRVAAFMRDVEIAGYRLGIPLKTRHNEAAPNQFEMAPIYGEANLANDQNQMIMNVMNRMARKHGFVLLLHEKPFAGINGSGKHNNWSLTTDSGVNLLEPGETPYENAQFLLFLVAVIKAVDEYQDLLRISVASAANDHRLGGGEAPPAVVSMFLGDDITMILEAIEQEGAYNAKDQEMMKIGVHVLPKFPKDTTDRNRTSPFAFTGNKFEFRMLGASASPASANIVLNTAVAEVLCEFADTLEQAENFEGALHDLIRDTIRAHKRILFNGNGYDDAWIAEARERGLSNYRTTPEALSHYLDEKNVRLFVDNKVFSETEMAARKEINEESYNKVINIEARTMLDMVRRAILPAVSSYKKTLSDSLLSQKSAYSGTYSVDADCIYESETLAALTGHAAKTYRTMKELEKVLTAPEKPAAAAALADYSVKKIVPLMAELRTHVDAMEPLVPEDVWPYPGYGKLLFSVQ